MHEIPGHHKALIIRFLEKDLADSEIDELYKWLQEKPIHREWFDRINETFQTRKVLDQFTPERVDNAWSRFQSRMEQSETVGIQHKTITTRHFHFLRIAAMVSLLLAATAVIWKLLPPARNDQPGKITVLNPPDRKTTFITLPDSTLVWLNANSTLEYSVDFGSKDRVVNLKGEAFFDVRKKNDQNFIVRTDQLSVRVKGTRFNVRAYQEEDLNTTLEEGKVELLINGESQAYSMIPGDQVIVKRNARKITLQKVDPSNYTAWKEAELIFDNTPLSDIILKLENRFKVEIEIADEIAQRERLTMTIGAETIEDILEMIQLSSRLHYEMKDKNHILIYE